MYSLIFVYYATIVCSIAYFLYLGVEYFCCDDHEELNAIAKKSMVNGGITASVIACLILSVGG